MAVDSSLAGEILTEREAARLTCFSCRTLQAWRQRNSGPPFIKVGRSIRYSRSAVVAWMNAQTCSPASVVQRDVDKFNVTRETAYLLAHTMACDEGPPNGDLDKGRAPSKTT
jgi:predicted DNA-binding transcriptional regulator AlpA